MESLATAAASVNKELTLAVTSDKGLCGGLNSSITKHTRTIITMNAGGEMHGDDAIAIAPSCSHQFAVVAEEGSGKVQTIVSIGDKGRAQLTRALPALYAMGIADTYKAKVTFNQVGCGNNVDIFRCCGHFELPPGKWWC